MRLWAQFCHQTDEGKKQSRKLWFKKKKKQHYYSKVILLNTLLGESLVWLDEARAVEAGQHLHIRNVVIVQ